MLHVRRLSGWRRKGERGVRARGILITLSQTVFLCALSSLTACAHHYVDGDGNEHVIGLVKMEIIRSPGESIAGSVVAIESLGLSVTRTPDISFLNIGFIAEKSASLANNAIICGNPLQDIEGGYASLSDFASEPSERHYHD